MLCIVFSCDFKKQKNRAIKKVKRGINQHIIDPAMSTAKNAVVEFFKEDTTNLCESYRPDRIVAIAKDYESSNPFIEKMIDLTPDSLLEKIDQSFFIQDSARFMPLYFPFSLQYNEILEGNFYLNMDYCHYSHLGYTSGSIGGDIDRIWIHDYWLAARRWDSDQLLGMSSDLGVGYFLINMKEQIISTYNSEKELLEDIKKETGITSQLKEANDFLEWYNK